MPDLHHTLNAYDLDLLKIIAGKWGLVQTGVLKSDVVEEMVNQLADPALIKSVKEQIPVELYKCLESMADCGGKMPWSTFVRQYGNIREMGIARREREKPFDTPASIAESLWYYGLIGRAFLNPDDILREYAYIPDEFLDFFPVENKKTPIITASPALKHEYRSIHLANDYILDHLTSFLSALRSGRKLEILIEEFKQPSILECQSFLFCAGLIDQKGALKLEEVKNFLANTRGEALKVLCDRWFASSTFNELHLLPDIIIEGAWQNNPLITRQYLIEQIKLLERNTWWNIDSFISNIKSTRPDFQRPPGDFESWTIRSKTTGSNIHGFDHWNEIDGTLIRYLIAGPMHWLGFLDLGYSQQGSTPKAFRFSGLAENLFLKRAPEGLREEKGHLTVMRNGRIICPRDVPRAARYQLARFCDWSGINDKGYIYQFTVDSLQNAIRQGLQIDQLLVLLTHHASGSLPASLVTSLKRLAKSGPQANLKHVVTLQVTSPEVMTEIRNSPIGRFLGEPLNPTTVVVTPAAAEKIIPRLLELGYFCKTEGQDIDLNK